jgi:hypothetical protein
MLFMHACDTLHRLFALQQWDVARLALLDVVSSRAIHIHP